MRTNPLWTPPSIQAWKVKHGPSEMLSSEKSASQIGSSDTKATAPSSFSFWDLLDFINPLQHIPGVSYLYQQMTGDEMKPVAKVMGGGLFGGVTGLITGAVDAIVEVTTGEDIAAHVVATVEEALTPPAHKPPPSPQTFAVNDDGRKLPSKPAPYMEASVWDFRV